MTTSTKTTKKMAKNIVFLILMSSVVFHSLFLFALSFTLCLLSLFVPYLASSLPSPSHSISLSPFSLLPPLSLSPRALAHQNGIAGIHSVLSGILIIAFNLFLLAIVLICTRIIILCALSIRRTTDNETTYNSITTAKKQLKITMKLTPKKNV